MEGKEGGVWVGGGMSVVVVVVVVVRRVGRGCIDYDICVIT